jgi:hypothetical protein
MSRVELQPTIEIDLEDILQGIAQLEIAELEKFTDRVMDLRASRRAPRLSKEEADLLRKINQGLSTEAWQRYENLNQKLHEETISPEDHQEFLKLVDQIEMADAERLFHLIELSRIRRVSVDALMEQLGIRRSNYA